MESSCLSGSSKRAKAPSNVGQVAHCLVDGCKADLSRCREYHRRHKVCEAHSKTPRVTIGGREQRFCQQCSRFHSLAEFDEVKRSCRKRLDGHNRRRRKPQPDSRSSGMFFSSQQGSKLLSFSSSQIFPTSGVTTAWPGLSKGENGSVLYNNQPSLNCIDTRSYKGLNQFQFIREASFSQPLIDQNSDQKLFSSSGLDQIANSDPDRALSLLSSVNREIGLSHVVQPEPLIQGLNYGGQFHFYQETESKARLVVSDMMHRNNMPDGSSTSGSNHHHTHTFIWEQE